MQQWLWLGKAISPFLTTMLTVYLTEAITKQLKQVTVSLGPLAVALLASLAYLIALSSVLHHCRGLDAALLQEHFTKWAGLVLIFETLAGAGVGFFFGTKKE
jgi:hypothetical protein